jgi:tetratricopeptide (TPR) repeat protein
MDMLPDEAIARFRTAFTENPLAAFRLWYRFQEELRDRDAGLCIALADDFWGQLAELEPAVSGISRDERARFFNGAGAFFGSPGPAADLARARECFRRTLLEWTREKDADAHGRALHNLASAVAALGATAAELAEAVSLYRRALELRGADREIARAATLHNLGIALRRLAELDSENSSTHLNKSRDALREALELRRRHGLSRGDASTLFQLGLTLRLLDDPEGVLRLREAARALMSVGLSDQAALAERLTEE